MPSIRLSRDPSVRTRQQDRSLDMRKADKSVRNRVLICAVAVGTGLALSLFISPELATERMIATDDIHLDAHRAARALKPLVSPLELHAVPSIAGAVRDDRGLPKRDATVCAACNYPACGRPGPPSLSCTSTDGNGNYALYGLVENRYQMSASAPGYRPSHQPTNAGGDFLVLFDGDPKRDVDFTISPGASAVSGIVMDAIGGPIAGAAVTAIRDLPIARTSTDDLGRFTLWVDDGPLQLHVAAEGYGWAYEEASAPAPSARIVLQPASAISGVVHSGLDGSPLGALEVRATKFMPMTLIAGDGSASSGADGAFDIRSLSPGSYDVTASGPGWFGRSEKRVVLGLGDVSTGILVTAFPASSVTGHVVTSEQRGTCPSGTVLLSGVSPARGSDRPHGVLGAIGANGEVVFESVPSGDYQVTVDCEGHLPAEEYALLHVPDHPVHGVVWRVRRSGVIEGKVVDTSSTPVASRRIIATDADSDEVLPIPGATTDASGNFRLGGLPPRRLRVAAAGAPESGALVDFTTGQSAISIKLVVALSGRVRVDISARQTDDLAVYAFGGGGQWSGRSVAGHFELDGLPEGSYEVVVTDGRNRPVREQVTVRAARESKVAIRLPESVGVLRGRVLDSDGEPVRDAWVRIAPNGVAAYPRSETIVIVDTRGQFVVPDLQQGERYDVEVLHDRDGDSIARTTAVTGTDVTVSL